MSKRSPTKIGLYTIGIILVIGLLGYVGYALLNGNLFGISLRFGADRACLIEPTNANCICEEGYERLSFKPASFATTRYYCESVEKVINPDNANYESEALALAENTLNSIYPSCNMYQCNQGDAFWRTGVAVANPTDVPNRVYSAECYDETQGIRFASISLDIEDGSVLYYPTCYDYSQAPEGESHGTLSYRGCGDNGQLGVNTCSANTCVGVTCPVLADNILSSTTDTTTMNAIFYFSSQCSTLGDSYAETEFIAPLGTTIESVTGLDIVSNYGNRVILRHNYVCGGQWQENIKAVFTLKILNSCGINTNGIIDVGDKVCSKVKSYAGQDYTFTDGVDTITQRLIGTYYDILECQSQNNLVKVDTSIRTGYCDDSSQPIDYQTVPSDLPDGYYRVS